MNRRQKELLRELLNLEDFVSARYLAEVFQVSTKTIYKDLSSLEDRLKQDSLTLVKTPRYGIAIEGSSIAKSKLLFELRTNSDKIGPSTDFSEREMIYLRKLILENEVLDILDLALDLYISESSVRRDLEKIDQLLRKHNLYLIKTNGEITIGGDETAVRHFFRTFLIEKCDLYQSETDCQTFLSQVFSEKQLTEIETLITHYTSIFTITIPGHLISYLILDLLIHATRIKQGHFVRQTHLTLEEDLEGLAIFPIASELLSSVTSIPINQLLDAEIHAICLTLLSIGYVNEKNKASDYKHVTQGLIEKVSELSGVDFTGDDHLRDMITNHMRPMIYRLKNNINITNQTTEEIKKRYSILFNVVWMASKFISDQFDIKFYDSEITFLTIYFQIAVEKIQKPLLLYIICPHGLATSELIINSVSKIISHYDRIQKVDLSQLTNDKALAADMIISSVELKNLEVPYILVSPVLTQIEMDKIQATYHKLSEGNRKMLSVMSNDQYFNQSVISELVQDRIFLKQKLASPESIIHMLVQNSGKNKSVAELYYQSILQREDLGSTSVYTGIALPHADPRTVRASQLSFVTLAEPIQWGSNSISVVMLIAIKEGEEERYKDALIHLYSKISHQAFVNQLAQAKTKNHFINILLGKESQ
ncbi:BglG family transcription antiterminator [Streptococcus hongkongensis]